MLSIRDPIHGFIQTDELETALLKSRPLQRLRYVHQLGVTYLVYPGAEHSRFNHTMGVCTWRGAFTTPSRAQRRPAAGRQQQPRAAAGAGGGAGARHRPRPLQPLRRGPVRRRHRPRGHDPASPGDPGDEGSVPPVRRRHRRRAGDAGAAQRRLRDGVPTVGDRHLRARCRQDGLSAPRQPLLRRAVRQLRPGAADPDRHPDPGPPGRRVAHRRRPQRRPRARRPGDGALLHVHPGLLQRHRAR